MKEQQSGFMGFLYGIKENTLMAAQSLIGIQTASAIIAIVTLRLCGVDTDLLRDVGLVGLLSLYLYWVIFCTRNGIEKCYENGRWRYKSMFASIIFPFLIMVVPVDIETGKSDIPITELGGVTLGDTFDANGSWEKASLPLNGEALYTKTDDNQPNIKIMVRVYEGIVYRIDMNISETPQLTQNDIMSRLEEKLEERYGQERWFKDVDAWYDGKRIVGLGQEGAYAYIKDTQAHINAIKRQDDSLSLEVKLDHYLAPVE